MSYDNDNVFAKILRNEIPSHRVYEDEHTLAFMDVMPQTDGHTLVIPKAPSQGLLDAQPEVLGPTLVTVQRVAAAVQAAFDAPGIMIAQLNGPAAGQTVLHLHFHILPRFDGVEFRMHARDMADPALLAQHAEQIRAAMQ
jgi:histidine triad (HIT) family protein